MPSDRAILLQSFEHHARRAELTESGVTALAPSTRQHEPTWGHYDFVGGASWALYRGPGGVALSIAKATFPIDGSLALSLEGAGAARRLVITRAGHAFAAFAAPAPATPLLDETLAATAFAEEEDFDFARFVVNVAADAGRRGRIYAASS